MAATSTQGSSISVATQTAFGTPNTTGMKDIRLEGEPSVETGVGVGMAPDTVGANGFDNEKPIVINEASDSAMTATTLFRQAAVAGGDSMIVRCLKAAGCAVSSGDDKTVGAGGAVGSVPVDSATGLEAGMGVNVKLPDGTYMPFLIGDVATNDLIPVMALPQVPADGAEARKAFTVVPGKLQKVPDTALQTLLHADKSGRTQADDCATSAVGDIVFEPGEKLSVEFTFGSTNKTSSATPIDGTNDYNDGLAALRVHCPVFQLSDTPTDFTTATADSRETILSATIKLNLTCVQVPGFGSTDCVNNVQAWMQVGEPPTVTVEMLYDSDKLDDFDGDNTSKYIGLIQPGKSALDPAIGFFMINAHQSEAPVKTPYGNAQHQVTVMYTARPGGISGTTSSDVGNQPWALVLGDRSA